MTSFLPQVETTTSSISAGCVSGSETLFAVQSRIQKLNMLRGLSWPSGVTSALRQCYFFSFSNARPRGNVREAPSAKVQRGDFSVLHELQRRDERLSFFFFFVEGEMESSSLTAHSDHLSRFMKKKKKKHSWFFKRRVWKGYKGEGSRFAAESDTKNLASFQKWSSSGRFWVCFLHQKKNTKESTRLKWVKGGLAGWHGDVRR